MVRIRGLPIVAQVLASGSAVCAGAAQAADQGSLGPTSTGSIRISVSIAPRATVSGAREMPFEMEGRAFHRLVQPLCLSSNSTLRTYAVEARGGGDAGAFVVTNGEHTVGYALEWAAPQAERNETPEVLVRASSWQANCTLDSGSPAFAISFDDDDVEKAGTGRPFTGTLTLIVSPS